MAIPIDSFLNSNQEKEVTFLSGFDNTGALAPQTFATYNAGTGTYDPSNSREAKFGGTRSSSTGPGSSIAAGTPGGTVTYTTSVRLARGMISGPPSEVGS